MLLVYVKYIDFKKISSYEEFMACLEYETAQLKIYLPNLKRSYTTNFIDLCMSSTKI